MSYDVLYEVIGAGNSKRYFGKNYVATQVDEMALEDKDILLERIKAI